MTAAIQSYSFFLAWEGALPSPNANQKADSMSSVQTGRKEGGSRES